MKSFRTGLAALAAVAVLAPSFASAQLDKDAQKCVRTLHKDNLKVMAADNRRLAECLAAAHEEPASDVLACVNAWPGELVGETLVRTEEDTAKRCTESAPAIGLAFTFEQAVNEAAFVHGSGLFLDLFGNAPQDAGDETGNRCQAAALKGAHGVAIEYAKAATKCMATAIKGGATSNAALTPCFSPDLTKSTDKLAAAIDVQCEGVSPAAALPGLCSGATTETLAACIATRTRCRACRQTATVAGADADCDMVDDGLDNDSCSFPVTLSGNAFHFSEGTRVEGAVIWVLEHPEMTTVSDATGYFEFTELQEGEEATLVLEHPDFHPIQNGTIRLTSLGASQVTFQSVTWEIYQALANLLQIVPDEINKCQMVTTVTRVGKSLYDPGAHGEAHATVATDPPLPAEHGPIYFNSDVFPQPNLSKTSDDGGALYIQVPPGDYRWSAYKGTGIFTQIKSKCRAGLLVNSSPPWGLQKHATP